MSGLQISPFPQGSVAQTLPQAALHQKIQQQMARKIVPQQGAGQSLQVKPIRGASQIQFQVNR